MTDAELPLPGVRRKRKPTVKAAPVPSATKPIASIWVDTGVFHLDRPFDYLVTEELSEAAQPGVRVKVRFAAREVDGLVIDRLDATDHDGDLTPIRRVVSSERILTAGVIALIDAVAEEYVGTRWDVARLAIPPRHASTEAEPSRPSVGHEIDRHAAVKHWGAYVAGEAFLARIEAGGGPQAVWHAAPGADWAAELAAAVAVTVDSGRGAVVCLPDATDVARLGAALDRSIGADAYATLLADAGPSARYSEYLRIARGSVKVAIGTRAAAFAPVHDLGLAAIWDDGADTYEEPRTPSPHAREVLRIRAQQAGAALLVGGFATSVEAEHWVTTGTAHPLRASRETIRARLTTRISGATEKDLERDPTARVTRVPREAYEAIRRGLERGPVLIHTPRRGYAPALACGTCRTPARCRTCHGPIRLSGSAEAPTCGWCGAVENPWRCIVCAGTTLRASVIGEARTAEELGRTFPQIPVIISSGTRRVTEIKHRPSIVVATPGAEPLVDGGYAAVVVLDTWLARAAGGLRADEEAVRRWSNAIGLAGAEAEAIIVGDPSDPALQALVRWDQPGFAHREAAARAEAHLPPSASVVTVTGDAGAVDEFLTVAAWPEAVEVYGPTQDGDEWCAVVRAPRSQRDALTTALREVMRVRSARKLDAVKVRVDPADL
ncbi:putative primosomal protein N' [Nocardioides baekrokdamisoli]|uniref:Probable replication restart protein PriA n=1 Tax=Nocardioides baekrokdamisoli TaxID=1804624 RepID=A0A3G9IZX7_9ACTN|nr:primosome assembly protein PriA [Nocardioides baekrokdamisoli]BBH16279.1 putative primosomal protein N' [Nocardioides baekrokdamisoli]